MITTATYCIFIYIFCLITIYIYIYVCYLLVGIIVAFLNRYITQRIQFPYKHDMRKESYFFLYFMIYKLTLFHLH